MLRVLARVKLHGHWGLPEVEKEMAQGPVALNLPESVTGHELLRRLAERFGPRFHARALNGAGELRARVRLFIDDELVQDPAAAIGAKLRDETELSVVLLSPTMGG